MQEQEVVEAKQVSAAELKELMRQRDGKTQEPQTQKATEQKLTKFDESSMYDFEVDCVRKKVAELIALHPDKQARIEKSISDVSKFDFMKPHELKKML